MDQSNVAGGRNSFRRAQRSGTRAIAVRRSVPVLTSNESGSEAVLRRESLSGRITSLVLTKREVRRRVEEMVERAAGEYLETYEKPIRANPGMKLTEIVKSGDPMALWFTYALIAETKTLKGLTVVLIILTAVLALLTLRLAALL